MVATYVILIFLVAPFKTLNENRWDNSEVLFNQIYPEHKHVQLLIM